MAESRGPCWQPGGGYREVLGCQAALAGLKPREQKQLQVALERFNLEREILGVASAGGRQALRKDLGQTSSRVVAHQAPHALEV